MFHDRLFTLLLLTIGVLLAGCVAPGSRPTGQAAALPEGVRAHLGKIAVRGEFAPRLSVSGVVRGKGEGAASTAANAVGGMLGEAQEPGEMLAVLLFTPFVAIGGAIYGAAVADNAATVSKNLATLEAAIEELPATLARVTEAEFDRVSFVDPTFVDARLSDEQLKSSGYDSVIDVNVRQLSSIGRGPRSKMRFVLGGSARVNSLSGSFVPTIRQFCVIGAERTLSEWAEDEGELVESGLHDLAERLADQMVDDLFRDNAIAVLGDAPRPGAWGRTKAASTTPFFNWHLQYQSRSFRLLEGDHLPARGKTRARGPLVLPNEVPGALFDFHLYDEAETLTQSRVGLSETQLQLTQQLEQCAKYAWRVRARYESLGRPVSVASPLYEFKTPCKRRR